MEVVVTSEKRELDPGGEYDHDAGSDVILTHIGEQDLVHGMRKLEEGHVSFIHVLVQFTDGGGYTPLLSLETGPLEESSPVTLETIDVPICLDREALKNSPLLEFSKGGMIDDALMENVKAEEFVHEFVVYQFTKNPPGDHLEGEDRDEFLGFDDQFVFLLVPYDVRETR